MCPSLGFYSDMEGMTFIYHYKWAGIWDSANFWVTDIQKYNHHLLLLFIVQKQTFYKILSSYSANKHFSYPSNNF